MKPFTPLLALLAAMAVGLFFLGQLLNDWISFAVKPLPALCLAALVALGGERGPYRRALAIALVFCALGDFFLACDARFFLPGMGAFAIGHLGFAFALLQRERTLQFPLLLLMALWGASILSIIGPSLGDMQLPVTAYCIIISLVLWRSAAWFFRAWQTDYRSSLAIAGALLFAFSDSIIAINRFYLPSPAFWAGPVIMLTYWGSLVLFALTARQR